ncbi:glycoside hydrolase family 16 protein [Botryobasidium botryosum FD-172 SS1]|uniref:Glycoside hydrolase family 16 protein n=1 Tax=Botryobasidium botryosum (strain FD-172 SS1) TaxID=930990 RepID=A0A067MMC9_BOTB1|nr:glycoside hydrolase family 16 protein [Botryobasidium botryosum FD-172 SS1]
MHSFASLALFALPLLAAVAPVVAQGGQICGPGKLCPASAPCCSEYGFCGSGHFCLGGCNPLWSKSPGSCEPEPVCKDATHTFADNSRILSNSTQYNGNATGYDWVVDKGQVINTNQNGGELALLLTQTNGGTRISSTRYVHYGNITARMKTSKWAGVVSAFITMSDSKDEIDWEWPGINTTQAQTNYFWLGVANYSANHGSTINGVSDTYSNYHDYTIDWQPSQLVFSIDGKTVRTITKESTLNGGVYQYPTTPARVQISLWPAGINTSAPGTVTWAGGMINWNDPDYVAAGGHFSNVISSVTIKCADPTPLPTNATGYVYGANDTTGIPTILITNHTTMTNGAVGGFAGLGAGALGFSGVWAVVAILGGVVALL